MRPMMSSPVPGAVVATLCAMFVLAAPAPAAALPKKPAKSVSSAPKSLSETLTGPAKAEYEGGKLLYQDGDHANALLKFTHAYELSNDARLLWNVAACEKNLRHYTRVLAAVEKYQKDGGALLTDQDRQDANDLAQTVRTLVSTLTIAVDEPGADVFVDDQKVGTSPLAAPFLVDVGSRKIRVAKPGFKEFQKTEALAGASTATVTVKLEKEIHEGRLVVEAGAADAISVDGKLVATGRWEGTLPSGGHILRVTGPDKVAYQSEVVIQDFQTRRAPITLEAVKSTFPLKPVLFGSGGALLAVVGVVVTVVLVTRTPPPQAQGTISPGVVPVSFGGFRFGGTR